MRNRFLMLAVILAAAGLGCGQKQKPRTPSAVHEAIEVKHRGKMWFKLYPDKAPNVTAQFVRLSKEGFYDGLLFWRISDLGLVQSGCPNNDGSGHAGNLLKEEIDTTLHHKRGTLSMMRFSKPWTTSSQFLICRKDVPQLDGVYTIIGDLIKGEDVLDAIEKNDTIATITIQETFE